MQELRDKSMPDIGFSREISERILGGIPKDDCCRISVVILGFLRKNS